MNARIDIERGIVERYSRMADASRRMLSAARVDNWDEVCRVEKECASIVAELSTMGDLAPTDPVLRQQKLDFMKQVLADDAEIHVVHVVPTQRTAFWFDQPIASDTVVVKESDLEAA